MSEFHFLRPYWLLALLPLAALSWRLFRLGRGGGDWRRLCDPALLPHILIHDGGGKPARRASLFFTLGGLLAILALAGPVWERLPAPAFRNEAALVIALDLSRIMEAADLKPSRLERARFKIADILKQRKDGLTALLVYSGDAFTVTPLTDDSATINSQLSALTSDLMPAQGSRCDLALALAGNLLKQAGLTRGDVLLISNGVNLDQASDAAKELKSQGYRVSILGAGGEEGAPVPLPEGGFLQDGKGNIVISKLAAPALRQLANEGGGMYQKLATDNSDLSALLGFFERQAHSASENQAANPVQVERWEERGIWLLPMLLPIAALAFRRGYLAVLVFLLLPLPKPAQALEWQDLWHTRDQRASQAFQSGDPAKAAEVFENPAWKAAAQYKSDQFEEAAKTLQGQDSADAQYNLGNALAKQSHYPQAIAAYDRALKLNPKHEDAHYNKELVEKAMKEQQQDPKQSDKNPDQQDKGGQKNDQNQQQGQKQSPSDSSQDPKNEPQDSTAQNQNKPEQPMQNKAEQAEHGKQDDQQAPEKEAEAARQQEAKHEPSDKGAQARVGEDNRKNEETQADEQWLRRIPDDPGGLLRRKFQYQYQQRQAQQGRRGFPQ
ncbi:MAG: VWA domain-containing protein [Methylococcaceae bacterium]|nr:VWA domain-containing protein [Methylococcaceae bacterium]